LFKEEIFNHLMKNSKVSVPQTHAVDQSTIKSGLGQGIYDARHCDPPWRDIVGT